VVTVYNSAIKIVEVRGGEAAAIERNEGAQLRRNHRDQIQNHPEGFVAALAERLDHFQALGVFEPLLQRTLILHLLAEFGRKQFNVHALEKLFDGLGAHHGFEAGRAILLVEFSVLRFVLNHLALTNGSVARLDYDVSFEVQDGFKIAQRNIEQVADSAGQSLEEPDMRARRCQLDVAEPFTAHFGQRDFHTALVADDSAVFHALVLAAETLPIGDRTEDAGAKQTIALRLEGAVVDGLWFGYLAVRPAPDFFGRGQADA